MKISRLLIILLSSVSLFAQENFIGVVKPKHDIKISVSTDGKVKSLFVKEGSIVKANDKLIQLDDSLQELETQRRKLIWQDNSKLKSSIEEEKILSSLYSSTKKLYETSGGVSKDELQSLQIRYLEAKGETQFLKESKKKDKLEYEISKKLLDQYTLYSPINGIITKLKVDLGEFVKNTDPILHIVDSTICYVEMNVNKEQIQLIKKDSEVIIRSDSNIEKKGKIIFISPIADRSSGLFFVKVEFENKDLSILPGLTVNVFLD